jgi:hypothetical protein
MVMNDFVTTLASALGAEADRSTLTLDGLADARRLGFRLDRIDRDRRLRAKRTVEAVAAITAAAAVVVIAVVMVAGRVDRIAAGRSLTSPSSAVPGGLPIESHPYLPRWFTSDWRVVRRPHAPMPRLTHCVPAPSRWGARHVQGATYLDLNPWPHDDLPGTRVNEWLLQYPNASAAHRVLVNTLQQLKSCPGPADALDDPTNINRNRDSSWDYDEAFGSRRTWYTSSAHRGLPVARYVLRVARARNVLVVLEDTGITSERTRFALTTAVETAVPHFRKVACFCLH